MLLAAAAGLAGCGHLGVYDEWETRPSHPPLSALLVEVDSDEIARQCGERPGIYVHGCAKRDYARRTCYIYTRSNPGEWLVEHERRHCEGWDHPGTAATAASGIP